jgi:hypothetical protein
MKGCEKNLKIRETNKVKHERWFLTLGGANLFLKAAKRLDTCFKCEEYKKSGTKIVEIVDQSCEGENGPCRNNGKLPPALVYDADGNILQKEGFADTIVGMGEGIVAKLGKSKATGSGWFFLQKEIIGVDVSYCILSCLGFQKKVVNFSYQVKILAIALLQIKLLLLKGNLGEISDNY